jgi:hypothetical protein
VKKTRHLIMVVAVVVVVLSIGAVAAYASLAGDTTSPVTASDAVASYWNDATINLSATDADGVAYMYHELDGVVVRLFKVGTGAATVAAPLDRTGAHQALEPGEHTLVFWSQDVNGNVEAKQSVTFEVKADHDAPATAASGADDGVWRTTAATVHLAADDGAAGSGVASITSTLDVGTPVVANAALTDVSIATDGIHTLSYQAADILGNTETAKSITVKIDSVRPVPRATAIASARRGRTATLRYVVDDALPSSGTATVTIKVKNSAGRVVKTFNIGVVNVNEAKTKSFKVPTTWKIGTYRYYVSATDLAGNIQLKAGVNKLIVK